ncbi:small nuclear ribonucleoprotein U6 [Cryptosporidium xiaoi]|uniref:U6 snRNA-associated Sm-like protein LSm1 n=1 Tax=Cryptosporidium xiaoi TaxID=659607 RepID=A0AAV9XUQ0_9CRYT
MNMNGRNENDYDSNQMSDDGNGIDCGDRNDNSNQTTISSCMLCLEEDLDKEIYVVLRDGRQFTGIFRSFDQYGSLCLENSYEVFSHENLYNEIYQGCIVFRGDNLMLCGLINQNIKLENANKIPLHQILKIKQEKNIKSCSNSSSHNVFEWTNDDSI